MKRKKSIYRQLKTRSNIRKLKGNDVPEWAHRPLRLTIDELKDPAPVIKQFSKQYPLINMRALLSDWLFLMASHR